MVNEGYDWLMVTATSVFRHLQQMSGVGWVGFHGDSLGISWGFDDVMCQDAYKIL